MPIPILIGSYYFRKVILRQPSFIRQGHEDTHNETSSCTSEGYEVAPELRMNAPSCIAQGHEVMPELRMKLYL